MNDCFTVYFVCSIRINRYDRDDGVVDMIRGFRRSYDTTRTFLSEKDVLVGVPGGVIPAQHFTAEQIEEGFKRTYGYDLPGKVK
jgi:hypothetical protein